jgi:hypothetical protein
LVKRWRWISLRPAVEETVAMGRQYLEAQNIDFKRESTPINMFFGLDLRGNKITPA